MILGDELICPCGGKVKYYDSVKRIVLNNGGQRRYTKLKRYKCVECRSIHRKISKSVLPYKHYHSNIIYGVVQGYITIETIGYEDYPCEQTMQRWIF
jgi:hypothetical protein